MCEAFRGRKSGEAELWGGDDCGTLIGSLTTLSLLSPFSLNNLLLRIEETHNVLWELRF